MQILAAAGTILASIIAIVGANFTFMKFLLKDIHKEIEILKDGQKRFEIEHQEFRKEMRATNARMDGVYNFILKKLEK